MKRKHIVVQIWYLDKSLKKEDFLLLYPNRSTFVSAMKEAKRWFEEEYGYSDRRLTRLNLYSGYLIDGVRVLDGVEEREE